LLIGKKTDTPVRCIRRGGWTRRLARAQRRAVFHAGDQAVKKAELDIAARAVVERYAGMFTSGERKFYETTEQAVRAAARDLVSEFLLSPDDVDQAVKAAIEFIERGGRR
jgi:hypothetical protein